MTISADIHNPTRVPVPAILGLDRDPPGPKKWNRFFYRSPLIAQRLALLKNMVGSSSLVVVVVGERGSGKTTLMNQFITDAGNHWQIGRIKLKARRKVPAKQWRNLNNRMVFLSRKSGPPSVIIDDAHQLSTAELQLLLQYAVSGEGQRRIQSIVLLAEPQMRDRFAEMARWLPPKSLIDKIYMTPLTEKQTAAYLQHRLKAAGILRNNPFSEDQIRKIHKQSRGLPGWINGQAFLLLKKIGNRQQGFKKSILMGFVGWGMHLQCQLKGWTKFPWILKNMAFASVRRS
jgi:type II secretory pathway predicted ATPase ExeA